MLDLVRKRHDGDGWLVFTELANTTGWSHKRYADAVALGVWASTKYECHLYEMKISREDLKRELRDPTKANAVGKYCAYWWLVLESEDVMRDLVIPEMWGILVPTVRGGSRILKVVRKAPKQQVEKFSPMFAMAMIRNIAKNWHSPADYQRLQEQLSEALQHGKVSPTQEDIDKDAQIKKLERELDNMREGIEKFRAVTGVDLTGESGWEHFRGYQLGRMGTAFKLAQRFYEMGMTTELNASVYNLSNTAEEFERLASRVAESAVMLRSLIPKQHTDQCQTKSRWRGRCSCGVDPLSQVERKLAADAAIVSPDQEDPDPSPDSSSSEGKDELREASA